MHKKAASIILKQLFISLIEYNKTDNYYLIIFRQARYEKSLSTIIWRFISDCNIMGMTFINSRRSDLYELTSLF
jgi:hypothetical protein